MFGAEFPYFNMQQLNLDWVIDKIKGMLSFLPDDGAVGQILRRTADGAEWSDETGDSVESVNGKTGAVVLDADDILMSGNSSVEDAIDYLKSDFNDVFTFTLAKSINRLNPTTITSGAYIANDDSLVPQTGYGYSDFIDVTPGEKIRCTYWSSVANARGVFYDGSKNKLATITSQADLTNYTGIDYPYWECTIPTGAVYVRVNVRPAWVGSSWMVVLNRAFPTAYVAYTGDTIEKSINSDVTVTMPYYPKLHGKKIMFCGDSITYGSYADTDDLGNKKNFGWYIKQATGADVQFNAVQGSTMMNVTGKNPFSVDRYTQLGTGLDYIILAFVTNDSAENNSLIGQYGDTTNGTFWGAWKIVLDYLIQTYPTAKIGIIGFWRGNQKYLWTDALREIAHKYRIPFLDFMLDPQVPMVGGTDFRSYYPNAPFTVDYNTMVARQDTFLADAIHPNNAGYQYLATIIQQYIESL